MITFNFWTIVHFSALTGLVFYGLHRIWMLYHWLAIKKLNSTKNNEFSTVPDGDLPSVTVQLPLYNERFVAKRLLDAAAMMSWPADRFEIQVLDDSSDDTCRIVDERAAYWQSMGIDMKVIRRTNRTGYKAGALDNGLNCSYGEFIAIFDADFIPPPEFLHKTIPHFTDKRIGMVQARWGFLNTEHSWLTSVQTLLLGPHFSIEHQVRWKKGLFFNFNGTAGVWRRTAIDSSGGWKASTVTEDLDLSYRAQLAGWRFRYLEDVIVPSELPVTLASFRSQQQRWAKGSTQTARAILPRVYLSHVPLAIKMEASAHLLANLCWLLGFIVTLTLYPTILSRTGIGPHQMLRFDLPIFIFSSLAIFTYFAFYRRIQNRKIPISALVLMPIFTLGFAPGIALSVISGLFRNGGIFHRTAKFGISGQTKLPVLAFLYHHASFKYIILNLILFAYMILPILSAIERKTWLAVPFLSLFALGFLLVIVIDTGEFVVHLKGLIKAVHENDRSRENEISDNEISGQTGAA